MEQNKYFDQVGFSRPRIKPRITKRRSKNTNNYVTPLTRILLSVTLQYVSVCVKRQYGHKHICGQLSTSDRLQCNLYSVRQICSVVSLVWLQCSIQSRLSIEGVLQRVGGGKGKLNLHIMSVRHVNCRSGNVSLLRGMLGLSRPLLSCVFINSQQQSCPTFRHTFSGREI